MAKIKVATMKDQESAIKNKNNSCKVVVIGLGYVGLPLACCIAKNAHFTVFGLDTDKEKVSKINQSICPLKDDFSQTQFAKYPFKAFTRANIIKTAKIVLVCVPTPIDQNKKPNLKPLISATKSISDNLQKGQLIIIESTINPGVCEEVILPILENSGHKAGRDFHLAHCPERINPGDKVWNVLNIPRNVGALDKAGSKLAATFYRAILNSEISEVSSLKVAEATKVIENTFRDINIAYVNELAKSFDLLGIDLMEVISGASSKPFGFMPHFPSCGVGGHCIPVDPYYLIEKAKEIGFDHSFLTKAREVNNSMPKYTVDLLIEKLNDQEKSLKGSTIALLGLSYKANVADMRESPSLEILEILRTKGAKVKIYDPYFPKLTKARPKTNQAHHLSNTKNLLECIKSVDAILLATAHQEFLTQINSKTLKTAGVKIVIDGKNCLNKKELLKTKIIYKGIGS